MQPPIKLADISFRYGKFEAISHLDLDLGQGITGLVGVNGAGKSTLLRMISGGLRPSAGSVSVLGVNLYGPRSRAKTLSKIAFMPQHADFPRNMTVHEVVSFIGWMRGMTSRDSLIATRGCLEGVRLADRAGTKIKALSGGMLRRVALAQALVSEPEILLLDEPSTGLDPEQRRIMVELVAGLDATVLFSSHVIEDIEDVAQRVLVLDSGSIAFDGDLSSLAAQSQANTPSKAIESGFLAVLAGRRRAAQT
jgi:ABC-2 type transport system ATP-binding protein